MKKTKETARIWESSEICEGRYGKPYKIQVTKPEVNKWTEVLAIQYSTNGSIWTILPLSVAKAIANALAYFENQEVSNGKQV